MLLFFKNGLSFGDRTDSQCGFVNGGCASHHFLAILIDEVQHPTCFLSYSLSLIQDGTIRCWVLNTASQNFEHVGTLSGHTAPVVTLQCASNKLYSGSMDKTIRVWDLTANGACIQTLSAHENVVMSLLCWDQYLISCSLDNTIRVWGLNPAGQLENTYTYPEVEAGAVRAAQTPQDVSCSSLFV